MEVMAQPKVVLHVGCGAYNPKKLHQRFNRDEWKEIRLDIDPQVKPDILGDITNMADVQDGSVDAVWSSHNIEHLYPHQVEVAFREFYRVLRPGGFAFMTLPDIQAVARHVAEGNLEEPLYVSPAGPIAALDILYGFRPSLAAGNYFMAHKTGFTVKTLEQKLINTGFQNVNVQSSKLDLWAVGYKL